MVDADKKRTIDSTPAQPPRPSKLQKLDTLVTRKNTTDAKPDYIRFINKKKLDFDSKKVCSVTLSPLNVYCCLTCGKYFSGRAARTPAFLHSVNFSHPLFINVSTLEFYLLPQNIKIDSSTCKSALLDDIRFAIYPIYTPESIARFPLRCTDLISEKSYIQGFVGMSELQSNKIDHINVILLIMAHIQPIRDYLLLLDSRHGNCSEIVSKLSLITKKLWSPHLFRPHVSPVEFVECLSVKFPSILNSKKPDPRMFLVWLLTVLSKCDTQLKRILANSCLGRVLVTDGGNGTGDKKKRQLPFWNLTLDLPPVPLFKDGRNTNELPQVQLRDLILTKFCGQDKRVTNDEIGPTFQLLRDRLPRYLFLHIDRFGHIETHFPVRDRNQTIVNFPLNLVLFDKEATGDELKPVSYRLLANVTHEAVGGESTSIGHDQQSHWKVQLLNTTTSTWLEIDGTNVRTRDPELLFLNEAYLQVWEKT